MILEKLLACPKCKSTLIISTSQAACTKCKSKYHKQGEFWNFLVTKDPITKMSVKSYEEIHTSPLVGPHDGSYDVLASIAKGNKTLDIACGDGFIEKLAPNTVGLEFSINALNKARKNGAKYLIYGTAEALPFANDSFDICICAGSLEHFTNPQLAINEMARVSRIQVLTIHKELNIPGVKILFKTITAISKIKHQPIEKPLSEKKMLEMFEKACLHVVFKGVWTLPSNFGHVIKWLPEFDSFPSVAFVISIKK